MTTAPGRRAAANVARPFQSRIVRQEWATRAVSPMVDARSAAEQRDRTPVGPEAYES